ncbi:MAG: signal peptidase I [Deltaproteobacteria bacterium RBG_16_48_10]|nr:MAG: signal peptidase I [Deltaproteobacteria bacterium RBG_16_48_10]
MHKKIRQFFFPSLTPKFVIRASLVALSAYFFFGYICTPFLIKGYSMEPAYHNGGVNFCFKLRYLFSSPKRFDVVAVRFAGNRVMLLKRVVALGGEQIEFRDGKLFINSKAIEEPYVRFPCNWNLPPRQVERGHVYVVGDNRSMPLEQHMFGQTPVSRMVGSPLW